MSETPATLLCDFYKLSHRVQYPKKTEKIYSTWTPRSNKHAKNIDQIVIFGLQRFVKKYLIDYFNINFFNRSKDEVLNEYSRVVKNCLGVENPETKHLEELHDLRYLPIKIDGLREGTIVNQKIPMFSIENTHNDFFWLTNYLETLISCELWLPSTAASIALKYKNILDKYALETVGNTDFVKFQGHDFSMRGMGGVESSKLSGAGHLLSFVGTDTIPAILHLEKYYNANIEKELIGCSVNATEHSVMCAGGNGDDEFKTYKRLITEIYPTGIISIVSDTWDLWGTIVNIIPKLKNEILNRDGKVVIRPDSGIPEDIICGKKNGVGPEKKGVVELLWDIFGGIINEKGYKELDPHIGAIYGDAITIERCEEICKRLKEKGFASTNIVFGIGSYTYQYNTRDTFGFAMKSTLCQIDGEQKMIFKDPKTDDGIKKSQKGGVAVLKDKDGFIMKDQLFLPINVEGNQFETIFKNGKLLIDDSLSTIRNRLSNENT